MPHITRVVILGCLLLLSVSGYAADYIGANACKQCHQSQFDLWQKSDHFHAMQKATSASVLGDFENAETHFHNIKTRFLRRDNQYFIETRSQDGEVRAFEVLYTFGHQPLQQYLVDIGEGKLQAFDVAWDSRAKSKGGQRWFHLQPDEQISPEHPFFWQGHFQNWNSRCADCHSTDLRKNYNPQSASFDTRWSDINVACEACHGPGSDHLLLARSGKVNRDNTGLLNTGNHTAWQFRKGESIASPVTTSDNKEIDICGGCHSRRLPIAKAAPGANYHDQYSLQLLSPGLYFADGQIQDEVFVLGSFLQSKMYQQGVGCTDCHEPHSGEVKLAGNALCAQCHLTTTFDTALHHGHEAASPGSFCVDCHMPERRYMGVDDRRDHSFKVPKQHTENTSPFVCQNCHQDLSTKWLNNAISLLSTSPSKKRPSDSNTQILDWASANLKSRNFDMLSVRDLAANVADNNLAPIIRATLIEQLATMPSRVTLEVARAALTDHDPMVRRAATAALAFLPAIDRWSLLKPLADDKSRSVRFELAAVMIDVLDQLPPADQSMLVQLLDEYRESLSLSLDSPGTQLVLANLAARQGEHSKAEAHFRTALTISPGFVPALLNFAEYLRMTGQNGETDQLLKKALKVAPDSASVQHAWGLQLVRKKEVTNALPYLLTAATIDGAQPRFAYVYAVALDSLGEADKALVHLKRADQRWPNQIDILNTLLLYADKQNQLDTHLTYLSQLSALTPSSPLVKQLIQKYQPR